MSDDDKCDTQRWDDLSPAELCLLIEKEQASILHLKVTQDEPLNSLGKHQPVNEDEIFTQLTATKRELYFAEQYIQKLDHSLQQAEQRDPQYLSKQLNSLEHQTSNISYLIEAVDVLLKRTNKSVFKHYKTIITNTITHVDKQFNTLTHIVNNIADRLERIKLNQVVITQRQPHTEPKKVKEGEESLFFDSPPHIPTGLLAYNPERDGDPEPFLRQLENNLQIVNLHPSIWNMALAKYTQGSKIASHWVQNNIVIPCLSWHEARDLFATHFSSTELQTRLHDEFFKLSHRPKELVRKVIERMDNILQQMTEQPSEAQKIAVLKCCLNPCLLESVNNMLLSWNAEKYNQAVQIALSVEANLYTHKAPSSMSCPLHPTSGHSAAECKRIKQMKDGTQTPSKANTGQRHNGNNNGSSSSSSSSSGHPLSSNKHTCCKCSAPWHPGHQCKPRQPAALNASQAQTSTSQQPASASLPPSSLSPSPAPSLAPPPSGTNQPSTNALDATAKQEFMEAVHHAWEIQGNVELAAIDLNSLLHPGNASDSTTDAPSPVVTPEAIHVEGLNTDDDDDVEDDCKDKVEPPITAPILLNCQCATGFIDSGASHSFISPAATERYIL
ncbi:hypothetical protein QOT17_005377 [Balamuthia mandrillaris]